MTPTPTEPARLEILASRHFPDWLTQHRIGLAVSTYQVGKLLLLGVGSDGRLGVFERNFDRCMGLWSDGQTLWLASAFQLWRLENVLGDGENDSGYDRLYVPRAGFTTGDIDIHDLTAAEGRIVFVSTLFSCLATLSERYNFEPLWRPPFVGKLAAEDRCHLNGLALDDGRARYVTACGRSDVADGWRDQRRDGGCVLDVRDGSFVLDRLSMPHSPRLHDGRLWLLDSGRGYLGYADGAGRFERVGFCPGYARGLAFVGHHAVVGLSKPRDKTFAGLDLDGELKKRNAEARCGLQVIDLNTGAVVHWVRFEGAVSELYDVAVLPGVRRPRALGFKTDEIRRNVWIVAEGQPQRWTGQPSVDSPEASCQLAQRFQRQGRPRDALVHFQKAIDLDAQHVPALVGRELVRAEVCDWGERVAGFERLRRLIAGRLARGEPSPLGATPIAVFPFTAAEQSAIAQSVSDTLERQLAPLRQQLRFARRRPPGERLRVGYLSADFRNHATGHLMKSVFGLHDRRGFEVFAYSFGPDDGSDYRRRIESDCDRFRDITALSAGDAARLIHADQIDILVDLMGHAGNARPDILALRPAPVQVHYLGYPGSTGARFVDYFLADRVVLPPELAGHFREQVVWLPHCYQCNDHQQAIAERETRREEEGLPAGGFVFCCFNSAWKIDPDIFAVWMRILTQVPDSFLWLLGESELVRANLRREAAACGADAARLVFAELRPKPEHLARQRLAGLFLDTTLCNAHTTASDALWVGVPLLTCPGATFAARVAASLLTTMGLPELIVGDMAEYERRAVQLATHPDELLALRERLEVQRQTGPLFDTPRFVRNLERAYRAMSPRLAASPAGPPLLIEEPEA